MQLLDKGPAGAVVMLDDDPVIQCPELPLAIHGSCSLPVSFGVLTDFCRREAGTTCTVSVPTVNVTVACSKHRLVEFLLL